MSGDPDDVVSPIFMVESGECSFVTQVRNIEKAGGSLAIIIDKKNEDISKVTLSDDGTGAGIRIPAMLVSKGDGEILKKFLLESEEKVKRQTSLTAEFLIQTYADNSVYAEMWYTSSDRKSLDFVKNVAEYVEPILNDRLIFEPKFVQWSCPHCDSDFKRKNCVSGGNYCALQHDQNLDLDGREIIMEDLRQHCIFWIEDDPEDVEGFENLFHVKGGKALYFEYVKRAHQVCRNRIDTRCSKEVAESLKIDFEELQECVAGTFRSDGDFESENDLLASFKEQWLSYGSHFYPAMVINGKTFRGRLTPYNAFEAMCAAYKHEPKRCRKWQEKEGIPIPKGQTTGIDQRTLFIIIVVLVLVNGVIILFYRRFLQKELDRDMKI